MVKLSIRVISIFRFLCVSASILLLSTKINNCFRATHLYFISRLLMSETITLPLWPNKEKAECAASHTSFFTPLYIKKNLSEEMTVFMLLFFCFILPYEPIITDCL
jgi:hypothetical protein